MSDALIAFLEVNPTLPFHRAHLTPSAWGRRPLKTKRVTSGGLEVVTEHKYTNYGLDFLKILFCIFIHKDTANREEAIYGNNKDHLKPQGLHLITFLQPLSKHP